MADPSIEQAEEYRDPIAADRDARREARTRRRGATGDVPVVPRPSRPERPAAGITPVRALAVIALVGVGALVGALLTSADAAGWLVGVAVAAATLVLAALASRSL